jgi:hypothetical protein
MAGGEGGEEEVGEGAGEETTCRCTNTSGSTGKNR